jgi:hypothetical protein
MPEGMKRNVRHAGGKAFQAPTLLEKELIKADW